MRKCVFWPVVAFSLVAADMGQAQQSPDAAQALAQVCAKLACRKGGSAVLLRLPENHGFEIKTQPYPYLDDRDSVILYPGETVTIGFNKTGDALGRPVLVKVSDANGPVDIGTPGTAAATLSFTLKQSEGKTDMMLTAANGVPAMLKYDAIMFAPTASGIRPMRTSSCPLMPPQGGAQAFSGFESSPQPFVMMAITNIHALAPGAAVSCN